MTGLGPLRTRLQRSPGRGLTKFVGREREMEVLRHAADHSKLGLRSDRGGHGEPGVGKSRLFFEFKATSQSGWAVLETFSIPHGKALTLWQLGYPDQALKRDNEALVLALRQSQPFIVGFAELFAAVLRQYLRGAGAVQRHTESVIALSAEHELSDYLAFATTLRGWRSPNRATTTRGSRSYKKVSICSEQPGRNCGDRTFCACWLKCVCRLAASMTG